MIAGNDSAIRVAKILYQGSDQVAARDRVQLGPVTRKVGLHRGVDALGELAKGKHPDALGSEFRAQPGEKLFADRYFRRQESPLGVLFSRFT